MLLEGLNKCAPTMRLGGILRHVSALVLLLPGEGVAASSHALPVSAAHVDGVGRHAVLILASVLAVAGLSLCLTLRSRRLRTDTSGLCLQGAVARTVVGDSCRAEAGAAGHSSLGVEYSAGCAGDCVGGSDVVPPGSPLACQAVIERGVRDEGFIGSAPVRVQSGCSIAEKAELLARSNRDLEQFAHIASHDLREPLRMVTSYLQLLDRRYGAMLPQEAREFMGFALDGANRMQELVASLLEYSLIGREHEPFESVDMNEVAAVAVLNLAVAIGESGASVRAGELPVIRGRRVRLVQLIQNLVENALRYRGREAPDIRLSAVAVGESWQIVVTDNGVGIAQEHHGYVFEPFRRIGSRDEGVGSGIGLASCRRIVEQHGGQIWVESAVGKGSRFTFTLPQA